MASLTLNDIPIDREWIDLADIESSASGVGVIVQNRGPNTVSVVFGGSSEPTQASGIVLKTFDSVQGDAVNIWARGNGPAVISLLVV
jgi:hypothetical protein